MGLCQRGKRELAAGRDRAASVGRRVAMASIREEIFTTARAHRVWDAIRDVGALHTRLVPGFVVNTRLEEGARIVTFGNGVTVREPIVDIGSVATTCVVCNRRYDDPLQRVSAGFR